MKKAFMLLAIIFSLVLATILMLLAVALTREQQGYGKGVLRGSVSIGPICPVERIGVPCPVPPEAYDARKLQVFLELTGGYALYSEVSINHDGSYSVELPTGKYLVKLKSENSIDSSPELPAEVVIRNNDFTTLDISIDTGIR